nr:hypothetical protein [Tanacetum cinerariifolium]
MLNGICPLCHLSNSCAYDHNYHPSHPTYETYSGDSCGNDSHFGYDCLPQFSLNYEPEPGYIQNYNSYPHNPPSFPQQYCCCEDCRVTHEPYQCEPKNHDYYQEQNSCYDSNSIGFDQSQPQQYTVSHLIFNAHHDLLGSQKKLNITLTKVSEQMTSLTSMCELACQIVQKNLEEKQLEEEQAVKARNWKLLVCYDDDDDEESSKSLEDNIISELPSYSAVTPSEPVDSFSMGDEHLNTIPATESDEFIKSCVENLVPNPSKSEGENKCDVSAGFTTFSNVLFDADYDFDSSDDQSFSDEYFPKKIYSNPLFDEEIIPIKIDQHPFNVESDLIESMPNHDSSIIFSSKIDSIFDEFTGKLTLLKSIPLGIDETDCHPEEEIHLTKRLLYDNSSPRPPEEIVFENSNADIESFSPSPIPVEDSDSHIKEIDLPFTLDDPMPLSIEDDDYDSGRDILILEELLDNYSLSLPANESYHLYIPSPYRPLAKPPDEPGYIQNYNSYPYDSPSFPQQYPCCEDCGVTHEPYQGQPKNEDYYHEQNSCCDSNSIGFDQFQPQQYTVNHPIFSAHRDLLGSQKKLNITLTKQAVKAQNWKLPVCYNDDDDEESSNSLEDNIISELPSDDQSLSDEDVPEKIYSNPLFDEEINPIKIDQHSFKVESDLIESMPNHDSSITISSKIDSPFDEFAGCAETKVATWDDLAFKIITHG